MPVALASFEFVAWRPGSVRRMRAGSARVLTSWVSSCSCRRSGPCCRSTRTTSRTRTGSRTCCRPPGSRTGGCGSVVSGRSRCPPLPAMLPRSAGTSPSSLRGSTAPGGSWRSARSTRGRAANSASSPWSCVEGLSSLAVLLWAQVRSRVMPRGCAVCPMMGSSWGWRSWRESSTGPARCGVLVSLRAAASARPPVAGRVRIPCSCG